MKKITKFLVLSILFIAPILFAGCQKGNYYQIEAFSSGDSSLGTVHSNSGKKVLEGQEVKLTARESNPSQTPLYCWVKNNSHIVKYAEHTPEARDNTFSFVSSLETEGKYTAIFKESADNMMYCALQQTLIQINGNNAPENYRYTIYYTPLNAGTGHDYIFASNVEEYPINNKVLYFGSLGDNYQYSFTVQITKIIDETTTVTMQKFNLISYLNPYNPEIISSNFNGANNVELSTFFSDQDTGDLIGFSLIVAKLGYEKITV